ncbi:MAG: HPr(Ser) kinase/phosphatase [Myxococcota bacterium]
MTGQSSENAIPIPRTVTVGELLEHPDVAPMVTLRAGAASLGRAITHPRIQKSGLVLVGHTRGIVPTRVQILGETEMSFLEAMDPDTRRARLEGLFAVGLSLVVVTRGVDPLPELVQAAQASDTPLMVAPHRSSQTINVLHAVLDRLLAPEETLHGVLVEVHGIGILLLGSSGIGKSECALFLVQRGHRLVADDRVTLTVMPDRAVVGRPAPLLRHHLEVRGIGILNIRDLFGATAVQEDATVDLVAELVPWEEDSDYERLGLDDMQYDFLGVTLPMLRIPVRPGRDMAVILEVAARNQLLKRAGHHAARKFARNLAEALGLPDSEPGEG